MTVRRTSLKILRCGGKNCAIPDPQIESIADDFKVWIETARTAALKVNVCSIPPQLKPVHAAESIFCLNAAIESMTSDMDVSFANMHDLFHHIKGRYQWRLPCRLHPSDTEGYWCHGTAFRRRDATGLLYSFNATSEGNSTCHMDKVVNMPRSQPKALCHPPDGSSKNVQDANDITYRPESQFFANARAKAGHRKKFTNVQQLGAVVPVNHVPNQVNEEIDSAKRIWHLKPIYEINSDKAMNITQETPSRATDMVVGIVVNLTTTLRTVGMVNPLYVTTVDNPVTNWNFAPMVIHMGTLHIIQCPMGEAVIDIEGTPMKGRLLSPLIHQSLKTIKLTARWCS